MFAFFKLRELQIWVFRVQGLLSFGHSTSKTIGQSANSYKRKLECLSLCSNFSILELPERKY